MDFKILVDDNSSYDDIINEHGLSIYIETNGKKILFDSGASDQFCKNAEKMGVDLKEVDFAIASHGHYDHTGGFLKFFEINNKASLYIHEDAFRKSYVWREGAFSKETTGIRWSKEEKIKIRNRIIYTDGPEKISEGIWISGSLPREEGFEFTEKFYYYDEDSNLKEDDMSHEQCLIIKEDDRIYIFSGCSHRGAYANIKAAKSIFPKEEVRLFAGGLHLVRASEDAMVKTAQNLLSEDIKMILPLHCTGKKGADIIRETTGNRYVSAAAGDSFYGC